MDGVLDLASRPMPGKRAESKEGKEPKSSVETFKLNVLNEETQKMETMDLEVDAKVDDLLKVLMKEVSDANFLVSANCSSLRGIKGPAT